MRFSFHLSDDSRRCLSLSVTGGETETQRRFLLALTLFLDSKTPPWPGRRYCSLEHGAVGDSRLPMVLQFLENEHNLCQ